MAARTIKASVVGGSTLLGRELLNELSASVGAVWDLRVLEEDAEAEGQLTSSGDEALVTHALSEDSFQGLDLVFFCTDQKLTSRYLTSALQAGSAVVDLSGATRDAEHFLVRSPWLESKERPDLTTQGVTVPHPATLMLSLVRARLAQKFGPVDLVATVMEPASQAGAAGVDELHQQTVGLLSFQEVPKAVFGHQVAFNLQATLGEEAQVHLGQVRRRIAEEIARIAGAGTGQVTFSLLQAPVFHGSLISAHVRFSRAIALEAVRGALAGGVVVADEDTEPSNQAAADTSELLISVGRDDQSEQGCWLLLAADNLRLVARSAVQLGMELVALRPDTYVQ